MKNILLTISYDGTPFSGWQRQPGQQTVQGEIEKALSSLCGKSVLINGCSRTDAGVHGLDQKASFKEDLKVPTENLAYALNNSLPGSIRILSAEEKEPDFHARFDCKGKTYIYRIYNGNVMSPFARNRYYRVGPVLDTIAMKKAAEYVIGTHDFACFQATGGTPRETTIRTIYQMDISEGAFPVEFHEEVLHSGISEAFSAKTFAVAVTGDGFLYNMVRIIAGTLVDVGLGKIRPEDIPGIINGKDRTKAGHTAPARGLYLAKVYYEEEWNHGEANV